MTFKIPCIGRELNPGLPRGRREFYHWTTDAYIKWLQIPLKMIWFKGRYLVFFSLICSHHASNIVTIKLYDPDVIWTRNLLIWSQTRYRCATESIYRSMRFLQHLICCDSVSLVHLFFSYAYVCVQDTLENCVIQLVCMKSICRWTSKSSCIFTSCLSVNPMC